MATRQFQKLLPRSGSDSSQSQGWQNRRRSHMDTDKFGSKRQPTMREMIPLMSQRRQRPICRPLSLSTIRLQATTRSASLQDAASLHEEASLQLTASASLQVVTLVQVLPALPASAEEQRCTHFISCPDSCCGISASCSWISTYLADFFSIST